MSVAIVATPVTAFALAVLFGCGGGRTGPADAEGDKALKVVDVVAKHLASLPEEERLRVLGYSTTKPATTANVYRNAMRV